MALIAAGLAAEGQSRLSPLETVERGYGQLVDRLKMLGAQVEQVEQRVPTTSGLTTLPMAFLGSCDDAREIFRNLVRGQAGARPFLQLVELERDARTQLGSAAHALSPFHVVHTDDDAFGNRRMCAEHFFDFERRDLVRRRS